MPYADPKKIKAYGKKYRNEAVNIARQQEFNKSTLRLPRLAERRRRLCLGPCGKLFLSAGPFNRICVECKRGSEYQFDVESHTVRGGRR